MISDQLERVGSEKIFLRQHFAIGFSISYFYRYLPDKRNEVETSAANFF